MSALQPPHAMKAAILYSQSAVVTATFDVATVSTPHSLDAAAQMLACLVFTEDVVLLIKSNI